MLTIVTAATDRTLLTLPELRSAAGVADNSRDADLVQLGRYIAAAIARACRVATAPGVAPTLRAETITETIELDGPRETLILARRPVTSVTTVTENATALTAADYRLDGEPGLLQRRSGTLPYAWMGRCDVVVTYVAGYATVPDELAFAARKFVTAEWQQAGRDPMLRRRSIPGVSDMEWWVDPTKDNVIPAEVMTLLEDGGFVNAIFG